MADQSGLNKLREEIDEIDDKIHALLQRRIEIVEEVARSKGLDGKTPGTQAIRTGREAEIVGRLLGKTSGGLSQALVARVWREIISASTGLQGPMSVAVGAPNKSVGYWDLARDQFGSSMPMQLYPSNEQALQKARAKTGTIAVLPIPGWKDRSPWWPSLCNKSNGHLKVIARLPVVDDPDSRFENLKALVLADSNIDDSANDTTLVVFGAQVRQPPNDLQEWLKEANLSGNLEAVASGGKESAPWLHLVSLKGRWAQDSDELATVLRASDGNLLLGHVIGGYISPFGAE